MLACYVLFNGISCLEHFVTEMASKSLVRVDFVLMISEIVFSCKNLATDITNIPINWKFIFLIFHILHIHYCKNHKLLKC